MKPILSDEISLEDRKGMRCCLHCVKCAISKQSQLSANGLWYCPYKKEWRGVADLFEYLCPGFQVKDCRECIIGHMCIKSTAKYPDKYRRYTYCRKNFRWKRFQNPDRLFIGRRFNYQGRDKFVYEMERRFKEEGKFADNPNYYDGNNIPEADEDQFYTGDNGQDKDLTAEDIQNAVSGNGVRSGDKER